MDDDLLNEIMGLKKNLNQYKKYEDLSDNDLLIELEKEFDEYSNIIICSSNVHVISSNENNDIYQIKNPQTNKYYFCCLCGKLESCHNKERHAFFAAFDEHRCIKCKKFFFEHRNVKGCNWVPTKFLE
jgi:hypothetical protein